MNDEEVRIISRSKDLLGKDRLDALEGKGRNSRIQEEVRATENALKALQTSLHGASEPKWQKRGNEPGESPGLNSSSTLRSPRTFARELLSTGQQFSGSGSKDFIAHGALSSGDNSRTYLSKESQVRISQICVVHGAVPEERPATVSVDGSESIPIWSGRMKDGSVDLNKVPFPELGYVSMSQRRDMAPHISTIYDQIFIDPDEDQAAVHGPASALHVQGPPSVTSKFQVPMQPNAAPPPVSVRAPPAWRNEEGFWVDFRSVDLGPPPETRAAVLRESRPNYGSVAMARPESEGFISRNWDRLKVCVLALAVVGCCYSMWRVLVGLSDTGDVFPSGPAGQ